MRRMAEIALDINNAPRDPLAPTAAYGVVLHSSSWYGEDNILDLSKYNHEGHPQQVRLAETFLGIAESLRIPRGSLLR